MVAVESFFRDSAIRSIDFCFFLCRGGDFTTTSTARSKRSHASDSNSTFSFFEALFAMTKFRAEQIKTIARYDLSASLAREIGRFLATWAHFEHYVQALVWSALALGAEAGRLTVREPRVTDRLDMLRDICELYELEPVDYVLLLDIRKRANPLAAKRHLLAHSLWTCDKGQWCALVTRGTWAATQEDIENYPTGSKAVLPEAQAVNASDVREWTRQTIKLIEDIKNLDKQHRLVPPPLPKKQQSQSAQKSPTQDQGG